MLIRQVETLPSNFKKPIQTYETKYMYTGFRRYDTYKKVLSSLIEKEGKVYLEETPCDTQVFSRVYHTELVKVNVYQQSPLVWSEQLSPTEIYFFIQEQQTA